MAKIVYLWCTAALAAGVAACRPSDVLSVPPPSGVVGAGALANLAGAEAAYAGARGQAFGALAAGFSTGGGDILWGALLADEFTYAAVSVFTSDVNVDARQTAGTASYNESGDYSWKATLQARSSLLLAIPALAQYEPPSGLSKVGEAYALVGYMELFLAEDYCAGTPLDQLGVKGEIQYGTLLTTDSLFGEAIAHFDTALAHANGDAAVSGLARAGLGRALLGRGQFAAAAAAVDGIPPTFVYNIELVPSPNTPPYGANLYAEAYQYEPDYGYQVFNVADAEGTTGLPYRSAHDPRLTFDSSKTTDDGGPLYMPIKFTTNFADLPLATGTEAALVQAEAALQTDPVTWLSDLNALRTTGTYTVPSTGDTVYDAGTGGVAGLAPLADPGTDTGRVSLHFRERAFWLFGTGERLGDLRRMIRQYGRNAESVFPTGPYPNGNNPRLPVPLPVYGGDVSLTLPTAAGGMTISNPAYKGCLTSPRTA